MPDRSIYLATATSSTESMLPLKISSILIYILNNLKETRQVPGSLSSALFGYSPIFWRQASLHTLFAVALFIIIQASLHLSLLLPCSLLLSQLVSSWQQTTNWQLHLYICITIFQLKCLINAIIYPLLKDFRTIYRLSEQGEGR